MRLTGKDRPDAFVGSLPALASLAAIPLGLAASLWARVRGSGTPRKPLAISLGLLLAWIVVGVLVLLSWGMVPLALVCGTLGGGLVAGLFFGSPPPRAAARWFGGFAAGLGIAVLLAAGPSWLFPFFVMTVPLWDFETGSAFAAPLLYTTGFVAAELSWRSGREPLGIGVGSIQVGLLTLAGL
jgi:hypothetical protein